MIFVFAGAGSLYGIRTIKDHLMLRGINAIFVENEYMMKEVAEEDRDLVIRTDVYDFEYDYFIPLNEFWVSYAKKIGVKNISKLAYEASRSKMVLSNVLEANNLDYVKYNILDKDTINNFKLSNTKIIIKPEGLYSGKGINIVDNGSTEQLEKYYLEASTIKESTKKVLDLETVNVMYGEYIEGTEYSVDVWKFKDKVNIVRFTMKINEIINGTPCVIAYKMVKPSNKIEDLIKKWIEIFYDDSDITFTNIDFIVDEKTNRVIPIDFSCRIAGGMKKLFLRSSTENIYLNAILRSFDETKDEVDNIDWCQFNVLSYQEGKVTNEDYNLIDNAYVYVLKQKGSIVKNEYSSANSRLAEIVKKVNSEEEFLKIVNNFINFSRERVL